MRAWLLFTTFTIFDDSASAFMLPLGKTSLALETRVSHVLLGVHDVSVTLPGGEVRTVGVQKGKIILEALEEHDIEAPYSCRAGLCTE